VDGVKVFNYKEIEAVEAEEGSSKLKVRLLITKKMGATNFAMRLFEMASGGCSSFHGHPWEHEVFILEGEGILTGEGEERSFNEGDVIFIAPNEKHQLKNNSEKTMKFLCLIPCTQFTS